MTYQILDGKKIAEEIKQEVREEVEGLIRAEGVRPGLAFVLVGDDPASKVYVRSKAKSSEDVNIYAEEIPLPANISEEDLLNHIHRLNARKDIHGILVQHPLPPHIQESIVYESILPGKDVDGFHPFNMGKLLLGDPVFVPCTPLGIREILKRYKVQTSGAHTVIVGRSNIVGKPAAALFFQKCLDMNSTVTVCHTATKNLKEHCLSADILIAAIGKAEFIKADMVKKDAVVIDVGMNRISDAAHPKGQRLVGDVDFKAVSEKVKAITPVPGGVGLMTVAMLMKNTVKAAELALRRIPVRKN
jgi:methylenetetrahydrofolate dehydrogenase (NADP+)/methenyltetrahydrofolate cyclohydrolase